MFEFRNFYEILPAEAAPAPGPNRVLQHKETESQYPTPELIHLSVTLTSSSYHR